MNAKETKELKRLQRLWYSRRATMAQMHRAMDLQRKRDYENGRAVDLDFTDNQLPESIGTDGTIAVSEREAADV